MFNLGECNICPHKCGVNRSTERGYCQAPLDLKVNLYQLHFGEEPNLCGNNGSGTIFFSHCNTRCVYCQNFSVSQFGWGKKVTREELADIMLNLQRSGAHNINFVSPTHYTPQIIDALMLAKDKGLRIPVIWNSNAYERPEVLRELEGLVDIFLPDFRYHDNKAAKKYSDAEDYPQVAAAAIKEMFRQVGHLKENKNEVAVSGIMIRILLLPGNKNRVDKIFKWIHDNLGKETYISFMGQYYPTYMSTAYPELNRAVSQDEYKKAVDTLSSFGFRNGYIQDKGSIDIWTPKFLENGQ